MVEQQGLGGIRVFDPGNLNYLIKDHLKPDPEAEKLALFSARANPATFNEQEKAREVEVLGTIEGTKERTSKYHWDSGWWENQGSTPECTAAAALHYAADGPVTQPELLKQLKAGTFTRSMLYSMIQAKDRLAGRYFAEGATSLAMALAMRDLGWIGAFYWGYTLAELITAVLSGPVLFGIDWFEGMDNPDKKYGIIRALGRVRGGHEIVINGVDLDDGFFRFKQSWERKTYGKNGHVLLPFEDAEKLIARNGDVLLCAENKLKKVA